MDFYFNIVTVINVLTSVINAIVLGICYRKRKDFLSGIVTVAMEKMQSTKETHTLQLNDDVFTTESSVTYENSSTKDTHIYSIPWIFLIVLLTMLVIFALYWIFVLITRHLMRKSNACRYIFPCYRSQTDYLVPATDIFLDVIHVSSGEQIRVFLTTCSLSFNGSVKVSNFISLKRIYLLHCISIGIIVFFIIMNMSLHFLQKEQHFCSNQIC